MQSIVKTQNNPDAGLGHVSRNSENSISVFHQTVSCKFLCFPSLSLGELSGLPLPPRIGLATVQVLGRQVQKAYFKSNLLHSRSLEPCHQKLKFFPQVTFVLHLWLRKEVLVSLLGDICPPAYSGSGFLMGLLSNSLHSAQYYAFMRPGPASAYNIPKHHTPTCQISGIN